MREISTTDRPSGGDQGEVSIHLIVPTRETHPLLPRLVASLQSQTHRHWRVTFIDGASGPDHRSWLEALSQEDPRFRWLSQASEHVGIFGAMNQGFALAAPEDWLLFWGSDDWAAGPDVFARAGLALAGCHLDGETPDLLVCRGRYYNVSHHDEPRPMRATSFQWRHSYRRSLLLGSTPPHQATLIGPGARTKLNHYAPGFRLSADLDYFLRLSSHPDLKVCLEDLELVHMGDGGVSGQQTRRRLLEVQRAYRRAFGLFWPFPFLLRYGQRIMSRVAPSPSTP